MNAKYYFLLVIISDKFRRCCSVRNGSCQFTSLRWSMIRRNCIRHLSIFRLVLVVLTGFSNLFYLALFYDMYNKATQYSLWFECVCISEDQTVSNSVRYVNRYTITHGLCHSRRYLSLSLSSKRGSVP